MSETGEPSEVVLGESEPLMVEEKSEDKSEFDSMLQERELFRAWNEVRVLIKLRVWYNRSNHEQE